MKIFRNVLSIVLILCMVTMFVLPVVADIWTGTEYENMTYAQRDEIFKPIDILTAPEWYYSTAQDWYVPSKNYTIRENSSLIENQHQCGSCVVFAQLATMSGNYKKELNSLYAIAPDLSEQHLMCILPVDACGGLNPNYVRSYIAVNPIYVESDLPYVAVDSPSTCVANITAIDRSFEAHNTTTYYKSNNFDGDNFTKFLIEEHKMFVSVPIFTGWEKYHELYPNVYGITATNHLVVLSGWITDDDGMTWWEYQNSWGVWWKYPDYGQPRGYGYYPDYAEFFQTLIYIGDVDLYDPCGAYDYNINNTIELSEAVVAINDYFDSVIKLKDTIAVINCYFNGA